MYEQNYKNTNVEKFFEVKDYIDSQRNIIRKYVKEHFREVNINITSNEVEKMVDIISFVGLKGSYLIRKVDNIMNRYDIFYRKLKISQPFTVERVIKSLRKIGESINICCLDFQGEIMYHLYANFYYLFQTAHKTVGVHSDLGIQHATYFKDFFSEQFKEHRFVIYQENIAYDFVVASSGAWAKQNLANIPYVLVSDFPTDVDVQNVFKLLDIEK